MTLVPEPIPEDQTALVEIAKVFVSAIVTVGGAAIGGPVGAGLGAGFAQATTSALEILGSRWREKTEADAAGALSKAIQTAHLSPDELVATLIKNPDLMLLAITALQAAGETALQSKVRLLGRVVGNAATDQALVDEGLLIARAVRLLEAPHVRVLAVLSQPPKYDGDPDGRATLRWSPAWLAASLEWPSTSVTAVLLTLQSASCVILASAKVGGGSATYRDLMTSRRPVALEDMSCEITDFGSYLLGELSRPDEPDLESQIPRASELTRAGPDRAPVQ